MNKLQNQTLNQSLKMKTPNRHQLPKKPQQSSKVNLLYFKYIETNFFFIETTPQPDQAEEEAAQIENEKPLAPKESQSDADREKTIDIE